MKNILFAIISFTIAVLLPIYYDDVLVFLVTKVGAGWVFGTIYIRVLVIAFFAIGLYALFQLGDRLKKIKFIWVFLIAIGPGFGISFIEPIYQNDYGTYNSDFKPENIVQLEEYMPIDLSNSKEKKLIAFFTTSCPHCKVASRRIGYNFEGGQNIKMNAIFPGTMEDADSFIADNNGSEFNYYAIDNDSLFLALSGGSFPSLFLLSNENEVISHWTGDGINYSCLDYLANEEP